MYRLLAPFYLRITFAFLFILAGQPHRLCAADLPPVDQATGKTVSVLSVGNSFSRNATRFLDDLAKAGGHRLVHESIIVGGASLELHANKAEAHEQDPGDEAGLYANGKSLKQMLQSRRWDFVTLQQASIKSHDTATYQPHAENLAGLIRQHTPQTRLLVHQTWAYRVDDPRFTQPPAGSSEPATQAAMYQALSDAYRRTAGELKAGLIPVGDAFYLADTDPHWGYRPDVGFEFETAQPPSLPDQSHSLHVGWRWRQQPNGPAKLAIDGHHANTAGEYLGACVWYEVLFDQSVVENSFIPPGLDPAHAKFLQQTAHRAVSMTAPLGFKKIVLTDEYFSDGIAVGDINQDGHLDIVSGPYWYAGPEYQKRTAFYAPEPLVPERSPSNSMFSFVHDFNGDGWPDILVLGRVHLHAAYWYENPGPDRLSQGQWEKHFAFERVLGESPTLVDLNGDGRPQLLCHWEGHWGWVSPDVRQPRRPWHFHPIGERSDPQQFYHGQGVGDLNGDGRSDIIINDGWFEQPATADEPWPFHSHRFSRGKGGAQMFADDLNGDGDADVITAIDAHGWGLLWFQQSRGGTQTEFIEHPIMGDRSESARFGAAFTQPHALAYADIDGDGHKDIVTGKRRWAHGPTGDIEPDAPPVVYWFQFTRNEAGEVRFIPHLIDDRSGVGVQIQAVDVNGDRRVDVLTASKLGSFLFLNIGGAER